MNSAEIMQLIADDHDVQVILMAARKQGGRLTVADARTESTDWTTAFHSIREWGLAEQARLDGGLQLSTSGERMADELAMELESGYLRSRDAERAIILVGRSLTPGERIPAQEVAERASKPRYGGPWSKDEILTVVKHLAEQGFVSGTPVWGNYLLEGATPAGVREYSSFSGARTKSINQNRTVNIGTNNGNVASGDFAQQSATVNIYATVAKALDFAAEHVNELPSELAEEAREALSSANAALTRREPDTHAARSVLERFTSQAARVTSSPKVANFLALIQVVLALLQPH